MDKRHLAQFAEAMGRNDIDAAFEHVSENVVLKSPIFDGAFLGKAEVRRVVRAVRSIIGATTRTGVAEGEDRVVTFSTFTLGGVTGDAMDLIQVDGGGLIDRITVMWRPLQAVLEGRDRLEPLLRPGEVSSDTTANDSERQ